MNEYKRKLSLAVIYGNVQNVMERFLRSFAPLVDEVILVRAIGRSIPDDSEERALDALNDICRNHGLSFSFGYYHNDARLNWPHVDNFAAARQLAFDMASNEWVMWADTDDILDRAHIPIIRRALDKLDDDTVGIQMPYRIPEEGLVHIRERIVRKDCFRWQSPIHECLIPTVEGVKMGNLTSAEIVHMPINRGKPSDERNMRILETIPESEKTISHKFHTFQTLRAVGRDNDAAAYGVQILSDAANEFGSAEKYEILIGLGQLAGAGPQREQLYLQAIAADPSRREAYGELVLCELQKQDAERMLAWARAMGSLPEPREWPWNARRSYWAWQAVQIKSMAMRASGNLAGAYALQLNHFKRHGANISLLHATRGRCAKATAALKTWLNKAADADAVEHIFAIDADDAEGLQYLTIFNHVIVPAGGGSVRAWNAAAEASAGQVLIQMSDDWEPPMHWDRIILDRLGDLDESKVLAVSDGARNDQLLCMAILTRKRWHDQGYLFHPDFFSVYSDDWFTHCAYRDGVVVEARDVVFEHIHPAFGKADFDPTYERGNSTLAYVTGKHNFERLINGYTTSHDVEGWCNYRDFYTWVASTIPDGGTFVEVGSWMGQSVIHLCQRLQDLGKSSVKVYCVDTWKGEVGQTAHIPAIEKHGGTVKHVFEHNIRAAGVDCMITMIEGDSAERASFFADNDIDGVYIDAAHDYVSVVKDLAAWYPKLKNGGIFSGHDYPWHEVKRAVDEWAEANGQKIQQLGSVWIRA